MRSINNQRRELIVKILNVPDDLDAIRKVRAEVAEWLRKYPNDLEVLGCGESLGMLESGLLWKQASTTST